MKTITKTLAAVGLSILLVGTLTNADAQGRGRGNGKNNNPGRGQGNAPKENPGRGHDRSGAQSGKDHDRNSWNNAGRDHGNADERHSHDERGSRSGTYSYHRDGDHYGQWTARRDNDRRYDHRDVRYVNRTHYVYRRPAVRWVSVQHINIMPRYIFYRDYDVYYDCNRDVFIWFSNGRWIVTTELPFMLHRVNLATATTLGVDYYSDDLLTYVGRKRPGYFSIRAVF